MGFKGNRDFDERLNRIDWSAYETAYGPAVNVPKQLARLASPDHSEAMAASHDLWCGLCHQKVQLGTAAVPALPFIIEVLDRADDRLTIEILDILDGMAIGTKPDFWRMGKVPSYALQLRQDLQAELPRFRGLTNSAHEEIQHFASSIVDALC
jgi:hypothetical protein